MFAITLPGMSAEGKGWADTCFVRSQPLVVRDTAEMTSCEFVSCCLHSLTPVCS